MASLLSPAERQTLFCECCQKQFKSIRSICNHKRAKATPRRFKCPQCGHGFNSQWNLKKHMRVHESLGVKAEKKKVAKTTSSDAAAAAVAVVTDDGKGSVSGRMAALPNLASGRVGKVAAVGAKVPSMRAPVKADAHNWAEALMNTPISENWLDSIPTLATAAETPQEHCCTTKKENDGVVPSKVDCGDVPCESCLNDISSLDDIKLIVESAAIMQGVECLGCELDTNPIFNITDTSICPEIDYKIDKSLDRRDRLVRCKPGEIHLHHIVDGEINCSSEDDAVCSSSGRTLPELAKPHASPHAVWKYSHTCRRDQKKNEDRREVLTASAASV